MELETLNTAPVQSLQSYAGMYQDELVNNILPFWLHNSKDEQNGGFFTCLDRAGKVYDTDKFMWLQGRQVWCFSYMYQHVAPKQEWLAMALHGARFMQQHGRDEETHDVDQKTKEETQTSLARWQGLGPLLVRVSLLSLLRTPSRTT